MKRGSKMEEQTGLTARKKGFWLRGLQTLGLVMVLGTACVQQETYWEGPPGLILWEAATAQRIPPSPELLARGRELYAVRCIICHGTEGTGRGPASGFLDTPPRDFTTGNFKFRTTFQEGMPSDLDLFRTITAGFPVYGMPSYRYLSVQDRWALVYYVKGFYPGWDDYGKPEVINLGEEPAEEPGAIDRARILYETKFKCKDCHGASGHGDGPRAEELKGQWGLPLSPRDFTLEPVFRKAGWRRADTARILATGLAGTDMPSFIDQSPDPETSKELWDVASYVEYLKAEAQRE